MPTGSEQNNGANNLTSVDNKQLVNGKIAIKPNSVKRKGSEAQEANSKTKQKKLVSSLANSSNMANIEKKTPKKQTVRRVYFKLIRRSSSFFYDYTVPLRSPKSAAPRNQTKM